MSNFMENIFGKNLKQKRLQLGMTQGELCEKAGIPNAQTISSYEKGDKTPGVETAAKIARALGVSLDWLCGLSDVTTTDINGKDFLRYLFVNLGEKMGPFDGYCGWCTIETYNEELHGKGMQIVFHGKEYRELISNYNGLDNLLKSNGITLDAYCMCRDALIERNAKLFEPHPELYVFAEEGADDGEHNQADK